MSLFDAVIDDLVAKRWSVIENFLPAPLTQALHSELLTFHENRELRAAHIGKDLQKQRIADIRGDSILWLDGSSEAQQSVLNLIEELRLVLNRELFLGLNDVEAHFAYYPPGAGYKTHLDSFKNNNLRRVTLVLYLNPTWSASDAGELVLYSPEEEIIITVPPTAGTLVCFMSEDFPHEVRTTQVARCSIAGWYRIRG